MEHLMNGLREDMVRATALADDHTREVAQRLIVAIDPAVRNLLIRTLSEAATEVSAELGDAVIDVTMQGADPSFTVRRATATANEPTVVLEPDEDAGSARVSLRLPETLKTRAEQASTRSGQSLNAWLVDAVRTHLNPQPTERRSSRRLQGWA